MKPKPPKCQCGHLESNHSANGHCRSHRSVPGGRVYSCGCESFRPRVTPQDRIIARLAASQVDAETVLVGHDRGLLLCIYLTRSSGPNRFTRFSEVQVDMGECGFILGLAGMQPVAYAAKMALAKQLRAVALPPQSALVDFRRRVDVDVVARPADELLVRVRVGDHQLELA